MVLMAIDHVRVYSGMPAGGPEPGIFFTRWVTHFCAPAFVFLTGTGAFFYARKAGAASAKDGARALARFLVTRGLLLVLLELTLIRYCWTFNLDYAKFTLAGVIWMLGWCMILLAAFVRLRPLTIGITGLVIIAAQQVFGWLPRVLPAGSRATFGRVWEFFYPSGLKGPAGIEILYVLIPWIGVMMAGYGFGLILTTDPARRRKLCLRIGLSAIGLVVVDGILMIVVGPAYEGKLPFVFRLLNQQKYPPSQLYVLMTLGPLVALVPFAERARGWLARVLILFGRVPLFYYLLHIPLIHLVALGVNFWREGSFHQEWYDTAPFTWIEEQHRWGLPLLYGVFIIVEVILYFACRWYAGYKAGHPDKKWLRYI